MKERQREAGKRLTGACKRGMEERDLHGHDRAKVLPLRLRIYFHLAKATACSPNFGDDWAVWRECGRFPISIATLRDQRELDAFSFQAPLYLEEFSVQLGLFRSIGDKQEAPIY